MIEEYNDLQEKAFRALFQHDWQRASQFFATAYRLKYGLPWNECSSAEKFWEHPTIAIPDTIPLVKLILDTEQLGYLIENQKLPEEVFLPHYQNWQRICKRITKHVPASQYHLKVPLSKEDKQLLAPLWNRCLYLDFPEIEGSLLADRDWDKVVWNYLHNAPNHTVEDQMLSPSAHQAFYKMCLNSTFWHDYGKGGGYLGSYLNEGFNSPLLLKLGQELREKISVLRDYPMTLAWAFKHCAEYGVGLHADSEGQIVTNFWLTPDSANLRPDKGGLAVYDVKAPEDWNPALYQNRLHELFQAGKFQTKVVPYKCNRMLMFNAQFLHNSDLLYFRSGYLNHRINMPLVFGFKKASKEQQSHYRWQLRHS